MWEWVNSLPSDKVLDYLKLKAVIDDKIHAYVNKLEALERLYRSTGLIFL